MKTRLKNTICTFLKVTTPLILLVLTDTSEASSPKNSIRIPTTTLSKVQASWLGHEWKSNETRRPANTVAIQDPQNDRYSLVRSGFKEVVNTIGSLTQKDSAKESLRMFDRSPSPKLGYGFETFAKGFLDSGRVNLTYTFRF